MEIEDKNLEDYSLLHIQKKDIGDKRYGDYWVKLESEGCGCCVEYYTELKSKNQALKFLKAWILIKEQELMKLKEEYKKINKEED